MKCSWNILSILYRVIYSCKSLYFKKEEKSQIVAKYLSYFKKRERKRIKWKQAEEKEKNND